MHTQYIIVTTSTTDKAHQQILYVFLSPEVMLVLLSYFWWSHFCMQVVIEGTVGSSYRGDIAIDDISMADGACTAGNTLLWPAADTALHNEHMVQWYWYWDNKTMGVFQNLEYPGGIKCWWLVGLACFVCVCVRVYFYLLCPDVIVRLLIYDHPEIKQEAVFK